MRVLKFGGSSVGSAENIRQVYTIVKNEASAEPVVVVLSAFSGITNLLEQVGNLALEQKDYMDILNKAKFRHDETIKVLFTSGQGGSRTILNTYVQRVFSDLENTCKGVSLTEELTAKTRARLMSAGELLSSQIICKFFQEEGLEAAWADSRELIKTDDNYLNAKVDFKETNHNLQSIKASRVIVMPGFIARTTSGAISTLGRGGSDYTAAIVAAALEASVLEIWTDVDGVMTANPKLVSMASPIPVMSYEEAMELSFFGAKVIYPPTVQPILEKEIPIMIKNTLNPEAVGTLIGGGSNALAPAIQGFSSVPHISLITLTGSGMVGVPGIAMRLFRAVASQKLNILFITQSSSEHTITIGLMTPDKDVARMAIHEEFAFELSIKKIDPVLMESGLTLVAAVGDNMRERAGIAGKMFSLLGENGINIRAIAQGSTERNISFVIKTVDAKKALNVLHEGFFLSETKAVHLFCIGVGNVGSAMIRQLISQHDIWKKELRIDVKIAGLANSRKMIFDRHGIPLEKWEELLTTSDERFDPAVFTDHAIELNLRNSIFVDNTASEGISELYEKLLVKSVHVVTSNKIAAAGTQETYRNLKKKAKLRNVRFLYETNVAAGLPVIKTIRELVMTGDHVRKIQAVLSGSLNFIFNIMNEDCNFSEAVSIARDHGYTEPDPSVDLSGMDVMRKILILAREAGNNLDLHDVENRELLPPESLKAPDWEQLYQNLKAFDPAMREHIIRLHGEGKKARYLASFENGKASVGLQEIDQRHPAYQLGGTDNLILLFTDRYREQPLVIQGAGAGPEVTASGVLGDIMSIANI
jgi:aspartokinase/homoserine dehydrogenase 1